MMIIMMMIMIIIIMLMLVLLMIKTKKEPCTVAIVWFNWFLKSPFLAETQTRSRSKSTNHIRVAHRSIVNKKHRKMLRQSEIGWAPSNNDRFVMVDNQYYSIDQFNRLQRPHFVMRNDVVSAPNSSSA